MLKLGSYIRGPPGDPVQFNRRHSQENLCVLYLPDQFELRDMGEFCHVSAECPWCW
jgi:hypothetical protein